MKLRVPIGCEVEILVIDNNSIDNTKKVVDRYSKKSPIAISYFHKSQQGLSAARNRALKQASGDYIGFLDDECVVQPDWLDIIVADIDEFAPLVIGGPYVGALFPGTAPKWFKSEYGNAYFLSNSFKRGYQKEFRASGGNMLLHRRVFETQQFDQNWGMKGDDLGLGEEVLLQERFLSENVGAMVFYEPRMQVAHYVLPQKMRLSYCARRQMQAGAYAYKNGSTARPIEIFRVAIHISLAPFRALFRDRTAYPYWQNYAFEKIIPQVMPVIGATLERLRRRFG